MRIVFMGTPDFAVPTLLAMLEAGHDVIGVYTQPPRRAGRGKKEQKSAVHKAAEKYGLTVFTPRSLKSPDEQAFLEALAPDYAVVVAYGQILPQAILDIPKYGCVNVHASLLPRWRGAAPIHRAIMAGDSETGVCIMLMEEGLDTGPILKTLNTPITSEDTTQTLHDQLARMGAKSINEALEGYARGHIEPVFQSDEGVTYAKKIDKTEAKIDWSMSAKEIDRKVRGLAPFPGAWFELDGERVKILAGEPLEREGPSGLTLDNTLIIGCGTGAYRVTRLQRAGKAAMDADAFLRGHPVAPGQQL